MRALAILGLLVTSALPCSGKGRIVERPRFSDLEQKEMPFELTLAPVLELGPLPSAALPEESLLPVLEIAAEPIFAPRALAHEIVPPHAAIVGRSRGAMLDRCRVSMRSVAMIGYGASPDGRPSACRLLTFVRRTKFREASLARKTQLRMRFKKLSVAEVPEMATYMFLVPGQAWPIMPRRKVRTYVGAIR